MFATLNSSRALSVASAVLLAFSLAGCGMFGGGDEPAIATTSDGAAVPPPAEPQVESADASTPGKEPEVSVEEAGGSYLFGNKDKEGAAAEAGSPGAKIGVNSYLWRASLDTISFMPLISVDPFGGVIITDWYSNPNAPGERFKLTVYVLDTELRADAVKVNIFKQLRSNAGWVDTSADPITAGKLEDAILTRARELRLASVTR